MTFPVPKKTQKQKRNKHKKDNTYKVMSGRPGKHIIYTELYQTEAKTFKEYLSTVGYSKDTCHTRYLFLKDFFCFLENRKIFELKEITAFEISEFYRQVKERKSLRSGQPLKEESIYSIMRCVQMYFGYLQKTQRIKINPASHIKLRLYKEQPERTIFTQEEIEQLYRAAKTRQERCILHIAYGCGLRASEVSSLNKEDIRILENLVIVQSGKNNKRRLVPINELVKTELQAFISSIENKKEFVFYNHIGERMQIGTLNDRLKDIIKRTDFGKQLTHEQLVGIGIHTLRHSIATHLLENGMRLEQVQAFLGHNHAETTEIYTHISQQQINNLCNDN